MNLSNAPFASLARKLNNLGTPTFAGIALLSQTFGCAAMQTMNPVPNTDNVDQTSQVSNAPNGSETADDKLMAGPLDPEKEKVQKKFHLDNLAHRNTCSVVNVEWDVPKPGVPTHDVATLECKVLGTVYVHRLCEVPQFKEGKFVSCETGWSITAVPQRSDFETFNLIQ